MGVECLECGQFNADVCFECGAELPPSQGVSEEEYERQQGESYELGKLSRLTDLSGELRERAGERFAEDNMDEAMWLKDIAEELEERHTKERERWEDKYLEDHTDA
jgi:hypothetical protein